VAGEDHFTDLLKVKQCDNADRRGGEKRYYSLYDAKQLMSCLKLFSKLGQCLIDVFLFLIASIKLYFAKFGNKGGKDQLIFHVCRFKLVRP
jgi:hypothetical protein